MINIRIGEKCNIADTAIIGYKESGKGSIIIGYDVRIDDNVLIRTCGGHIIIDDHVIIGRDTIIYGGGNVNIDKYTLISPRVQIYAQNHGIYRKELIRDQKQTFKGIYIGSDCWIGAGSIILDGCHIFNRCVIGAGSVLTKKIGQTNQVWGGNPARFIKERPYDNL